MPVYALDEDRTPGETLFSGLEWTGKTKSKDAAGKRDLTINVLVKLDDFDSNNVIVAKSDTQVAIKTNVSGDLKFFIYCGGRDGCALPRLRPQITLFAFFDIFSLNLSFFLLFPRLLLFCCALSAILISRLRDTRFQVQKKEAEKWLRKEEPTQKNSRQAYATA